MFLKAIEQKIQTEIQSNMHFIQYGSMGASAGDNVITFTKKFLIRPIVIVNGTIEAAGATAQPIVYVVSLEQDADNYYTGMTVYSDGTAQNIDWIAIGVVI